MSEVLGVNTLIQTIKEKQNNNLPKHKNTAKTITFAEKREIFRILL